MFRSVGSVIFGIASDRYGRKWPFIVNNLLFIALELVSPLIPYITYVAFPGIWLEVPTQPSSKATPVRGAA